MSRQRRRPEIQFPAAGLTCCQIESLKAVKDIRKTYCTGGYPAATWVQIERLFNPDLVLEVEVAARFPGG